MRTIAHSSETARHTYRVCNRGQSCLYLMGKITYKDLLRKEKKVLATFSDDVIAGASSRSATKYQEVRAEAQQDRARGT